MKLLVSGGGENLGVPTYSCGITNVGLKQGVSGQSSVKYHHDVLCISYITVTSTCVLQ